MDLSTYHLYCGVLFLNLCVAILFCKNLFSLGPVFGWPFSLTGTHGNNLCMHAPCRHLHASTETDIRMATTYLLSSFLHSHCPFRTVHVRYSGHSPLPRSSGKQHWSGQKCTVRKVSLCTHTHQAS